jgi:hypothetical protein
MKNYLKMIGKLNDVSISIAEKMVSFAFSSQLEVCAKKPNNLCVGLRMGGCFTIYCNDLFISVLS